MIQSKQRYKGKSNPIAVLNDAFLMMYQTKTLQTDSTGYEIDVRFEHQNAVKQTNSLTGKV